MRVNIFPIDVRHRKEIYLEVGKYPIHGGLPNNGIVIEINPQSLMLAGKAIFEDAV
jgi:hypothetical protein